jgi:hypothetical protein
MALSVIAQDAGSTCVASSTHACPSFVALETVIKERRGGFGTG